MWPQGFTYQPWWFVMWRDYRAEILSVGSILGIFLLYAGSLSLLLWLRPVTLARLGGSTLLDEVGEATQRAHWIQALIRLGTRLVFNPWITTCRRVRAAWIGAYRGRTERFADLRSPVRERFLEHPDVLDAWVERRVGSARGALEKYELFKQRRLYVALPVWVGDRETGWLIEQPSPETLRPLFDRERVVLPIVGVGGGGKTTLACAIARWALSEKADERLAPWRMLPVFVAEDTEDLLASIKGNLGAMVGGEELDDDIVAALLRERRLLVIVDALSERSPATQRHVTEIYRRGGAPNALVVTTRREPDFGAVDRTPVYTERISGRRLIPFIYEYLGRRNLGKEFDERAQLKLGDRVLALVEAGGSALNVTPLLVTLFVESALERSRKQRTLDELPSSVPEIYLDYLKRLNPKQADGSVGSDGFDDATVIEAARALGTTCLGANLVPGDVRREAAEKALKEAGFEQEAGRLVDRLAANGVVEERELGGAKLLRFTLDPVAEHLAAIDAVHRLGSDHAAWADELARLERVEGYPERISGFLTALGDCYVTYRGAPFNLPPLELPWQAAQSTRDAA